MDVIFINSNNRVGHYNDRVISAPSTTGSTSKWLYIVNGFGEIQGVLNAKGIK